MGFSEDAGQITPESMTQPNKNIAVLKMLIGAMAGVPTGGGESAAAGIGAGAGAAAGAEAGAGSTLAGISGLDAFSASPVTTSSLDLMGTLFPQPKNPWSSKFGVQDPTMAGIMDTIQRFRDSPFRQEGGIPGGSQSLEMPQLGGVTLPKRRTSGRMF